MGVGTPLFAEEASLATMVQQLGWDDPTEPTKVVGPIHFVGTRGSSVWLIRTPKGHIVLNTGMPASGPLIEASIKQLGFKPEDVELLLTCHAHIDHVGGLAYLKRVTGAQVAAMDTEVELLQSGGKTDFNYGSIAEFQFEPVTVDRVVHDGEKVTLGDVTLTAHKTAGHTRGSTTWVTTVADGDRTYVVVFPDGTSVNPGYRLVTNPSYPGIVDDYRRTFQTLTALVPDIWLAPHTNVFAFDAKRARAVSEGVKAWVDLEGYRTWLGLQHMRLEAVIAKE
jgi:metallo-beta-lactamase class B